MHAERLWRVRKRHHSIDAILRPVDDSAVNVEFLFDRSLIHTRRWPTRDRALDAATEKLRELQRAGWTTHW